LVFFYGRYGLPVPYKHDIIMVLGEPIPVNQNPDPTPEEIKEVHKQFYTRYTVIIRQTQTFSWMGKQTLENLLE